MWCLNIYWLHIFCPITVRHNTYQSPSTGLMHYYLFLYLQEVIETESDDIRIIPVPFNGSAENQDQEIVNTVKLASTHSRGNFCIKHYPFLLHILLPHLHMLLPHLHILLPHLHMLLPYLHILLLIYIFHYPIYIFYCLIYIFYCPIYICY